MISQFRLALAIVLFFLAAVTDFVSQILSVLSDTTMIGLGIYLLWPLIKTNKNRE